MRVTVAWSDPLFFRVGTIKTTQSFGKTHPGTPNTHTRPLTIMSETTFSLEAALANPSGVVSPESAEVVKATVGVVVQHIDTIVAHFYDELFATVPDTHYLFNMSNQRDGSQRKSLVGALLAASPATLEEGKLEALMGHLETVFHKHVALGVRPDHYKIVHDHFLGAVAAVLGDAVTDAVAAAWSEVVVAVSHAFIRHEDRVRTAMADATSGWTEPEPLEVLAVETVSEDECCKTLRLRVKDESLRPVFSAGQYLTVLPPAQWPAHGPRHYTITTEPSAEQVAARELSITVKKLEGESAETPDGLFSSWLTSLEAGAEIRARAPMGGFGRPASLASNPVEVFIGAGIGVTPLLPMASQATAAGSKVIIFPSARTRKAAALEPALAGLAGATIVHRYTREGDARLTAADIVTKLGEEGVAVDAPGLCVYVCGPRSFMTTMLPGLAAAGVAKTAIRFEAFGPTGELAV